MENFKAADLLKETLVHANNSLQGFDRWWDDWIIRVKKNIQIEYYSDKLNDKETTLKLTHTTAKILDRTREEINFLEYEINRVCDKLKIVNIKHLPTFYAFLDRTSEIRKKEVLCSNIENVKEIISSMFVLKIELIALCEQIF